MRAQRTGGEGLMGHMGGMQAQEVMTCHHHVDSHEDKCIGSGKVQIKCAS